MASNTYSFLDFQCGVKDPSASFSLGNGAGIADEGITFAMADDKASLTVGADGYGMHSLHAARHGTVTVRVLKTSPVNALLQDLYTATTASSANYGQTTIVGRNPVTGDTISAYGCGIVKFPDIVYGKDGAMQEWRWNSAQIDQILGTGTPAAVL